MTQNIISDINLEQQGSFLWKQYPSSVAHDNFWHSYQALITSARHQQQTWKKQHPPPSVFTINIPGHFIGQFTTDIAQWKEKLTCRIKSLLTIFFLVTVSCLMLDLNFHLIAQFVVGSSLLLSSRYIVGFFNAKKLVIEITPQQIIRYRKNQHYSKEIGRVEFQNIGSLKEGKNSLIVFTEGLTSGLEHNFEKNVVRIPKNLQKYREIKSFLEQVRVQKNFI